MIADGIVESILDRLDAEFASAAENKGEALSKIYDIKLKLNLLDV